VISAFGASEARSIEVCKGCPGTSSGSTSIGVRQFLMKSRDTLYRKSGCTMQVEYATDLVFSFPYSPPEIDRGPVYEFHLNHVLVPDSPRALFRTEFEEV
jgi:hypothetical protein